MVEHKRIRSGNYTRDYQQARDRAINAAEQNRLKGGKDPSYLVGCKTPWSSGMGHAPQRYDDHQKELIMMKIAKIKKHNAELCMTHYVATTFNKGGPGGSSGALDTT
jgi:hypothetical protein